MMKTSMLDKMAFVLLLASVGVGTICIALFGVAGVIVKGCKEVFFGGNK